MDFTLIPAIDVRDGRVVRLAQGDYDRQTTYGDDPVAVARAYADAGARWLHLVDLDAARQGGYSQLPLVERLRAETALAIQTGGGIRTAADIETLLAAGVERVVIGTQAVRRPTLVGAWLRRYGSDRITLALDTRQDESGAWRLPVSGWTEQSPVGLEDLLEDYAAAGLRHLLCTDISRDGMLSGFNIELYAMLAQRWPGLCIQASGGVRGLEDLDAARQAGAAAAILGRALLERRFSLAEALRVQEQPC
jgi:phosphoribosylformimino-5-aminoimidazole carboxamide ribotide isomerase